MYYPNIASTSAGRAPNTLLLAASANRSVLAEHAPGQPRRLAYCPYGSLPGRSRLAFNGEFREPQGWYHLGNGHRLYNPVLHRFNRPDHLSPFGKGGINAYAYCKGDPINFSDPTGRVPDPNYIGFLTPVLYDNPGASLFLTFSLLALNLVTAYVTRPATLAAQVAYGFGVGGAVVGMTGASMQIAGEKEAGRWVSIVGTILSGISVATKVGTSLNNVRLNWRQYSENWRERVRGVVMPWKNHAKVTVTSRGGSPVRSESPPVESFSYSRRVSESIPMNSVGRGTVVPGGSSNVSIRSTSISSASLRRLSLDDVTDGIETTVL